VVTFTVVVVLSLAAGLVVWAPWIPPPPLRPAGLAAGPSTANSIAFRWSRPPAGPVPDKYLILRNGTVAGSVAGTVTSYRQTGLNPGSTYQYGVVAVRGGKRSPRSALLTVGTPTLPISQARLQGSWDLYAKSTGHTRGGQGELLWQFSPACVAGACDVILRGQVGGGSFKVRLTRAGAVYKGQAVVANSAPCGSGATSTPDPTSLKIRIRVTSAIGNQVWAATGLVGTMVGTDQFVSSAAGYCPAFTYTASLAGIPIS
jgi:hypothetical protein